MSAKTSSAKKRATRTTSNIFAMFSQNQIAEFKEAFTFIDQDKDGLISKADLRTTFDALGRMYPDDQLQGMLNEAPGPLNFTMFLSIFGERIAAFKTFDNDETGMVNAEDLRKMLTKFGEKLTDEEMDLALAEARMDSKGRFNIDSFIKLITGSEQEEDG
ncbi:Myosin regulatory light polypeptide 9 [Sarcoptes scabiei]|nr:Myosin regulatory light polypeptide 9 [Sarcoptes scabiei]